MNADERRPYLDQVEAEHTAYALGEQRGYQVLCSWCRYFHVHHDYEYGDEVECTHPIEKIRESEVAFEGGDCWGFRVRPGASERLNKHWSDASGPRLVELIEMGAERRFELIEAAWKKPTTTIGAA